MRTPRTVSVGDTGISAMKILLCWYTCDRTKPAPSDRAVYSVCLSPLALWDCGFESLRRCGCLSVMSIVSCQVQVFATGYSLVQRSPTKYGVSVLYLETSTIKGPRTIMGVQPWKIRIPPASWMFVMRVVSCQVEVSATGWSLVQRSLTKCGVSVLYLETSTMRRPGKIMGVQPWKREVCDKS